MRTTSRSTFLVGFSFCGLGAYAAWPVKTIDFTNGGDDCDSSVEQYMQVEGHDFHDHPKFTMRWRQITGPCGEAVDDSELLSWTASYDGSTDDAEDDPPTVGDSARVQLNLHVCSPFGQYELDMDIDSHSDEGLTLQQRTSWLIKNGPDQRHIWDTVNSPLFSDDDYSPSVPGEYTWPLEDPIEYYSTLLAGPLPPLACASSVPSGTKLVGCLTDSAANRLLNSTSFVLDDIGPGGMTAQVCSDYCSGFDYFGLEFGTECYCGTAEEFVENHVDNHGNSDQCGISSQYLCTGDPSTACGGYDATSVYQRTQYSSVGCFQDNLVSRVMKLKEAAQVMSGEICFDLCNDGINTHFGTQYAIECWCAVDPDLTEYGQALESNECDMLCAGTTSGELCGGDYKLTAYEIEHDSPQEYLGCFPDSRFRVLTDQEPYFTGNMTNEVCISYCGENGHSVAATKGADECWCGESADFYGALSDTFCYFSCEGDATQTCGGVAAFSVFSTS